MFFFAIKCETNLFKFLSHNSDTLQSKLTTRFTLVNSNVDNVNCTESPLIPDYRFILFIIEITLSVGWLAPNRDNKFGWYKLSAQMGRAKTPDIKALVLLYQRFIANNNMHLMNNCFHYKYIINHDFIRK